MRPRRAIVAIPLVVWAGSAFAATVTPVANVVLMGGQNFMDGSSSSVGGNIDAVVTPVVTLTDRWKLFPTYRGFYQGTQDIQSMAGGGLLFRDSTGHALLFKSVHTFGPWKIKPSVGGSMQWLRETKDEDWGQGLFDYRKFNGGLEAEFDFSSQAGIRWAYDYYQLDFPNYRSLESAQDPTLSRELAGKDVINNTNQMATAGVWTPLPGQGRLDVTGLYNERSYADQPVVDEEGQLTSTKRNDTNMDLVTDLSYPFPGPRGSHFMASLGLRYSLQNSNQNHYDSLKTAYQSNYYDYGEWRVAPEVTAEFKDRRWSVTLGGAYERRDYSHRTTQDAEGNYLSDKQFVTTSITTLTIDHPLSAHTKLRFNGSMGQSHSNTQYEQVFQYNYRLASYGVGFAYEY